MFFNTAPVWRVLNLIPFFFFFNLIFSFLFSSTLRFRGSRTSQQRQRQPATGTEDAACTANVARMSRVGRSGRSATATAYSGTHARQRALASFRRARDPRTMCVLACSSCRSQKETARGREWVGEREWKRERELELRKEQFKFKNGTAAYTSQQMFWFSTIWCCINDRKIYIFI